MSKILVSILLLLLLAYPATALESTPAAKRPVIKQKIENRQELIASKVAALKTKLQNFKDQKKAQATERISNNLNQINVSQTNKMQKHLGVMSNILDKLEARVNQAAPDIKDPAKAKAAIETARTAISSASAKVTSQAQKDYIIQVSSESRVRADAKKQRDQLQKDLKLVRQSVVDAKQSVANAIRVAKSAKEATNSGQQ